MREILFRGKSETGTWLYGVPLVYAEDVVVMTFPFNRSEIVVPETVGQYTGLTDKNGTKIFEGDILLVNGVQKVRVFFEKGQFVIDHFALNLLSDRNLEGEVIGNIHDNKELLEG